MARLIVKSPYIKCGGGRSAGGYMRYIATRERVELIQDDRSPTRKQEQLIVKLVKDFPEARELDECGAGSKRAASDIGCGPKLLTLAATHVHMSPQNLRRKTKKESLSAIDNFLKIVVSLGWLFRKGCGIVCR